METTTIILKAISADMQEKLRLLRLVLVVRYRLFESKINILK